MKILSIICHVPSSLFLIFFYVCLFCTYTGVFINHNNNNNNNSHNRPGLMPNKLLTAPNPGFSLVFTPYLSNTEPQKGLFPRFKKIATFIF